MTSLPAGLTTALLATAAAGGDWGNLAGELRLFMEAQQDALDVSRMLNIKLSNEVDQLKAQLLAIPMTGPSVGHAAAHSEPKLLKVLSDPGTFDGTHGEKCKEWWTCVHAWRHENQSTLPGQKGICTMLLYMVGGSAGEFARGHLNAILCGIGEDDWDDFSLLFKKHFRSTNKKDQNRLAFQNLKQKGHPMNAFLLKFENYMLLVDYDDIWQIELLEQNANKDMHLILEKGCYASLHWFKEDLQQAGACKQLLDFI